MRSPPHEAIKSGGHVSHGCTKLMDAIFIKTTARTLVPATDHDAELLSHIKIGQPTKLTFTRVRNYVFHQKYFVLLNLAFDYWEPDEDQVGEKNFDQFRSDVIILAGFYEQWIRLDGSIRVVAKSISFASMSEDDFDKLYSKTIDVIIKYVLTNYTGQALRSLLEEVEAFE